MVPWTPRALAQRRPALAAFIGVFAATLLGFLAIGAVLPVLPRYVTGPIGAGDVAVGVVTGAFAVSAVVFRPIGGRLVDSRGRRLIAMSGMGIAAAAGLLYLVPAGVAGLVVARLVLGVGDGWLFTAGAAWIVDLAPPARRGQAIGLFGLAIWGGLTLGPIIGEGLLAVGSYEAVFVFAACSPLLGILVARRVPDHHVPVAPLVRGSAGSLVPRGVVGPGLALALTNVGYGTVAGFVILHLADRGIGHGAAVFTSFAASVVLARLALAALPDRLGPRVTAVGAAVVEAAGLAVLALAASAPAAFAGALVMGVGFSLLFPSLALLAVERAGEERRGSALGAFTAFFDIGVGVGAALSGAVAAASGYAAAFWMAAALAAAGAALTVAAGRGSGPRRAQASA